MNPQWTQSGATSTCRNGRNLLRIYLFILFSNISVKGPRFFTTRRLSFGIIDKGAFENDPLKLHSSFCCGRRFSCCSQFIESAVKSGISRSIEWKASCNEVARSRSQSLVILSSHAFIWLHLLNVVYGLKSFNSISIFFQMSFRVAECTTY